MDENEFRAEYAKSDRSTCKGCRSTINKDNLRLAIMVQAPNFDGKVRFFYLKRNAKRKIDVRILDSNMVSHGMFFQKS